MRCLEPAAPSFEVDAREVSQPGGGEELSSPYVADEELALAQWARDALALALPAQIVVPRGLRGAVRPVRGEPERGPRASARGRAGSALGEARRAEVRLAAAAFAVAALSALVDRARALVRPVGVAAVGPRDRPRHAEHGGDAGVQAADRRGLHAARAARRVGARGVGDRRARRDGARGDPGVPPRRATSAARRPAWSRPPASPSAAISSGTAPPGAEPGWTIAFALAGIEAWRAGRPRAALACGVACALLRVEAWPFLLAFGLMLWRRRPQDRALLVACAAAIPALWFIPELLGLRRPAALGRACAHAESGPAGHGGGAGAGRAA